MIKVARYRRGRPPNHATFRRVGASELSGQPNAESSNSLLFEEPSTTTSTHTLNFTEILESTPLGLAADTDTARHGTTANHTRPPKVISKLSNLEREYMKLGKQMPEVYESSIGGVKKQNARQSAEYEAPT